MSLFKERLNESNKDIKLTKEFNKPCEHLLNKKVIQVSKKHLSNIKGDNLSLNERAAI